MSRACFDEIQTVAFASPEKVGKVFCVLDETLRPVLSLQESVHDARRCRPCDDAVLSTYERIEPDEGTLDLCSPSLPLIESSS
jgi:hypothetical protein